jgi:hypothetical protein
MWVRPFSVRQTKRQEQNTDAMAVQREFSTPTVSEECQGYSLNASMKRYFKNHARFFKAICALSRQKRLDLSKCEEKGDGFDRSRYKST